jgi:hypothetical protein
MSDAPNVLDYLREQFGRLNQRLDRSDQKLAEVSQRLTTMETQIGHLTATEQIHYGMTMQRFDNVEGRLDRIERRLDLADAHAP